MLTLFTLPADPSLLSYGRYDPQLVVLSSRAQRAIAGRPRVPVVTMTASVLAAIDDTAAQEAVQ